MLLVCSISWFVHGNYIGWIIFGVNTLAMLKDDALACGWNELQDLLVIFYLSPVWDSRTLRNMISDRNNELDSIEANLWRLFCRKSQMRRCYPLWDNCRGPRCLGELTWSDSNTGCCNFGWQAQDYGIFSENLGTVWPIAAHLGRSTGRWCQFAS